MDALAATAVPSLSGLSGREAARVEMRGERANGAAAVWNATSLSGTVVSGDDSSSGALEARLEQEFEQRLADCPTLAYRVALGVLRNSAEAEDVAQEAMLRAYRNFHRLRERDSFRAWLVRTAWRLALDRIRSAGRRERRELAAMEDRVEAGVENIAATREFERHLTAALDALPEKLRMVMVLAAIEGYNTREVAKLLDVPEGTVKSRLHLARKRLAEDLRSAGVLTAAAFKNRMA
jgi:RNA polymerase sigma-70 factor, ECF subfamily